MTYPVAIVGSRRFGQCDCAPHWPPTDTDRYHQETCPKVNGWLMMLRVVTRLASKHPDLVILTPGSDGAEDLAVKAAEMAGVPVKVAKPKPGPQTYGTRAGERNAKLVEKAQHVVAVFADGPRSSNTQDTVAKALAYGVPVDVWHEGEWRKQ